MVEAAQNGHLDSFAALYERYYSSMVALAYSVLADIHLAEDAAQQAFVIACHDLPRLKRKDKFAAWLAGAGPLPAGAEAQTRLARVRSAVQATHFCRANALDTTEPTAFARRVAEQLVRSVPGYGDALAATLADLVHISVEQRVDRVAAGGRVTGRRWPIAVAVGAGAGTVTGENCGAGGESCGTVAVAGLVVGGCWRRRRGLGRGGAVLSIGGGAPT